MVNLAQSKSTSVRDDGMEILIAILKHLTAEELREARLVCREFNEIICTHPELFWAKNRILVNLHPINNSSKNDSSRARLELEVKWAEFNRLDLIMRHFCPNLHLHNVDLTSLWANKFSRRSIVTMHIEHLKMTRCGGGNEVLLFILVCVAHNLRHLEIADFSHLKLKKRMMQLNPESWEGLNFPYLTTMVLRSQVNYGDDDPNQLCFKLPLRFLQCIIRGAPNLQTVQLHGWSSETCHNFIKLLGSLPPEQARKIQCLEILCIVEDNPMVDEYLFLTSMEALKLPSLRKVSIEFDHHVLNISGLSMTILEEMTHSVETFLGSSAESLEIVKLINCPITRVIRRSMDSFPKLFRVETRGSFVTELDEDIPDWPSEDEYLREVLRDYHDLIGIADHENMAVPDDDPDTEEYLSLYDIMEFLVNALSFPLGLNIIIWIFSWAEWLFSKYPWFGVTLQVLAVVYVVWVKIAKR